MAQQLHPWTPEKLATKTKQEVEIIRDNAIKKGVTDLVELCSLDLEARKPTKKPRTPTTGSTHSDDEYVGGYHLVCKSSRGVVEDTVGQFRTASWVVAESNVLKSLRYGAYVALHESRLDASYRQGRLLGYSRSPRDMLADENGGDTKIEEGIEFLVEDTTNSYSWVGDGSAEKGYLWSSISSLASTSLDDEKKQ